MATTEERLVVRAQMLDELTAPVRRVVSQLEGLDTALTTVVTAATAAAEAQSAAAAAAAELTVAAGEASAAEDVQAASAARAAEATEAAGAASRTSGVRAATAAGQWRGFGLGFGTVERMARTAFSTLIQGATFLGGIAVIGGIAATVKQTTAFADEMERVHTQAGASQEDIPRLSKQVLELSKIVPEGPEALAQGLYHIASAGLPAAEQMDILKAAAQGAAMGNTDVERTTQAMIATIASGIGGVKNASDAMAQLNAIVGTGDMKMQGLTGAISTGLLSRAAEAHLKLNDVGAALATLTDNVMPAQSAATRLGMTISMLAAPSGPARKALGDIGLNAASLSTDLTKPQGLLVALSDLQTHLDKSFPNKTKLSAQEMTKALSDYHVQLEQAGIEQSAQGPLMDAYRTQLVKTGQAAVEQGAAITHIFGGGRSSAAAQVLLTQMDRFREKYQLQANISGKFEQDYADYMDTAGAKFRQLKSTTSALLIELGQKVQPLLGDIALRISDWLPTAVRSAGGLFHTYGPAVLDVFRELGRDVTEAVAVVRSLAPAIAFLLAPLVLVGPAAHLLGDGLQWMAAHGKELQPVLVGVVGALVGFRIIGTILGLLEKLKVAWVFIAANPFTLALAGVLGLAAAFTYLYTTSKTFRDWVDSNLLPVLRGVGTFVLDAAVGFGQLGKALYDARPYVVALTLSLGAAWLVIQEMSGGLPALFALRQGLYALQAGGAAAVRALTPLLAVAAVLTVVSAWGAYKRNMDEVTGSIAAASHAMTSGTLGDIVSTNDKLQDELVKQASMIADWKVGATSSIGGFFSEILQPTKGASVIAAENQFGQLGQAAEQTSLKVGGLKSMLATYAARNAAGAEFVKLTSDSQAMQKAVGDLIPIADKAGVHVGDSLATITTKMHEYQASQTGVAAATAAYATDMKTMGDATATASQKADALKRSLDNLNTGLDVQTAQINYRASLDAITQSFKDNGNSIDITTAKGRSNQSTIIAGKQSLDSLIVSMQKHGASAADMRTALDSGTAELVKQIEQVSGNTTAVHDLIAQMHLTPDDIKTEFQVLGIDEAQQKVAYFTQSLKNLMAIPGMTEATATTDINRDLALAGQHKAGGGYITGPGSGTSDSIPARLSNGEYVVKAAAVSKYGVGMMNSINTGSYAHGGLVRPLGYASGGPVFTERVDPARFATVYQGVVDRATMATYAGGGGGGTPGAAGGAARWAGLVAQVVQMLGGPAGAVAGILSMINMESGGNPRAINLTDSNAKAGHPSMGLLQTIIGTFLAYAGPFRDRGPYDPLANLYAALNYGSHTYGWGMLASGGRHTASGGYLGYDEGGWLMPGITPAVNQTGRKEAVMPQDIMIGAIREELGGPAGGVRPGGPQITVAPGAVQIDARGASSADAAAIRAAVEQALHQVMRDQLERT